MAKRRRSRKPEGNRIIWNAFLIKKSGAEERYIMRSDFVVLHMTLDAKGKSAGWKVDDRHELDMGAFRKRLLGLGFVVGRGGELPPEVGAEVSRIPTLSEIINGQPELAETNLQPRGNKMTQNLKILSTKELLALYNKTTGKTTKRFASRAVGERLTAAALASPSASSQAEAPKKPAAALKKPATPKARKVNGSAGVAGEKGKVGRPVISFTVVLTEAERKSNLQGKSTRQAVVNWLREQKGGRAAIEALEEKFGGAKVRAVIAKLASVCWVKTETAAA